MLDGEGQVNTGGEGLEALDSDLVGGLDLLVVGGVSKSEGEHALLLQVGLYPEQGILGQHHKGRESSGNVPRGYGQSYGR